MEKINKFIPLHKDYHYEYNNLCKKSWKVIMDSFSDSNLYQTTEYNNTRNKEENIKNFVLYKKNRIVSASQIRILTIPVLNTNLAYIRWGPLWKPNKFESDISIFRMSLRALRNEIVFNRGMILRVLPMLYDTKEISFSNIFSEEGFIVNEKEIRQKTLLINLDISTDQIRKNFHGKWRNLLNKAEKNNLDIIEGTDDNLFKDFISIYKDMIQRKNFREPHNIHEFRDMQKKLNPEHKMRIFLCRDNSKLAAGGVFSSIGDNGIYLLGATNDIGMRCKASYLIQWKAIQWMKESQCKVYNLNGINKDTNYGVYHFKKGIAGKNSPEFQYCGTFDSFTGLKNKALFYLSSKNYSSTKNTIKKLLIKG
jgi:lipid II:glycine glycyltransferase (peptidoglycan interpeptide bridge formation enzyme)